MNAKIGLVPKYNTIGSEEISAATRVLERGVLSDFYGSWGSRFEGGIEVRAFEEEWSEYFGVEYSISMNSATSGLIAAVAACEIGPGDEVIVSPFTMTASASCVRLYGATPVFADIEEDTFNLDLNSVEANITPRTKAIIFVDLAGQTGDMNRLRKIAENKGIYIIEDASQAPGSRFQGVMAGTFGDIGVFSLNCHKTIQTGEGGVCVTRNSSLAEKLKLIRNHGEAVVEDMNRKDQYGGLVGYNFRMGEIEAAIGREQLRKLERLNEERREIAKRWDEALSSCEGVVAPLVREGSEHVYYTYMMRFVNSGSGIERSEFIERLANRGVDCYSGYCRPLYLLPIYQQDWPGKDGRQYGKGLCPVAERMFEKELFYHVLLYKDIGYDLLERIIDEFVTEWRNR